MKDSLGLPALILGDIEAFFQLPGFRTVGGRGGIGRRAGFRNRWPRPWGFKSLRPHQKDFTQFMVVKFMVVKPVTMRSG